MYVCKVRNLEDGKDLANSLKEQAEVEAKHDELSEYLNITARVVTQDN